MQSHHETPRFWIGFFALLTAGLLALPTMAADPESAAEKPHAASDTALKAANALYEGIRAEKLDNGLRVYLKPVAGSPVVTTMVAYRVGSADEDLDNTGLSHYLEHLMFKGTDKLKPGDIDRMTQINGGQNNAYTTNDYTIFHFDFAADRWDMALQIEADRMQNLRIDEKHEFQQEKGAVISELRARRRRAVGPRTENDPAAAVRPQRIPTAIRSSASKHKFAPPRPRSSKPITTNGIIRTTPRWSSAADSIRIRRWRG